MRAFLLAAALLLGAAQGAELIGTPAPEWSLEDPEGWLRGEPTRLEDLRGHVVLVRFFTDGCAFCAASMPALQGLHEKYAKRGLRVVGLYHPKPRGARVRRASVERVLAKWGITFPVALDAEWSTLGRWWLDGADRAATSASFLIGPDGTFRWVHPGPELHPRSGNDRCAREASSCNRDFEALEAAIEKLLPPG